MAVAANVRAGRVELGISQQETAGRIGITQDTCGKLERGIRNPRLSTLAAVAAKLGMSFDELFAEETRAEFIKAAEAALSRIGDER